MSTPEAILRRRPFSGIANLVRLGPLAGEGAHSGGALLAEADDGRRFKLRVCPSERRAREIEAVMRDLPDFFPTILAREGRYLLIEYLEGQQLDDRKALRPFAHSLGRLYAEIHRKGALRGPRGWLRKHSEALRIRFQFSRQLRALRRVDAGLAGDVGWLWRHWRRRYGIPIGLELRDVHKANFMIDAAGRLRYVDEDGLMYAMRGMGLGKLIQDAGDRPGSPKRTREWYSFIEGYGQVADADYLVPEYGEFARMLELVRSVEFKLRRESRLHKVDAELAELRALVAEVKAAVDSADPPVAPTHGPGAS